jgi:hypothetical protein
MPEMSRQKTAVPKMRRADFFIAQDDSGETFAGKLFQNSCTMLKEATVKSGKCLLPQTARYTNLARKFEFSQDARPHPGPLTFLSLLHSKTFAQSGRAGEFRKVNSARFGFPGHWLQHSRSFPDAGIVPPPNTNFEAEDSDNLFAKLSSSHGVLS